jgi:hypothetical protein
MYWAFQTVPAPHACRLHYSSKLRRIETVRRETAEAETRAQQVAEEVKELHDILAERQRALEEKLDELNRHPPFGHA